MKTLWEREFREFSNLFLGSQIDARDMAWLFICWEKWIKEMRFQQGPDENPC